MDAAIFDMDGVIVDSEQYWHEEAKTIFQAATTERIDIEDAFEGMTGMYISDIYDALADRYEMAMPKEAFLATYHDRAASVYREKVVLMDGFHDLLMMLDEAGVVRAIASSSPRQWIEWVVERFDLTGFAHVVSAEDIDARSKPEPDIYVHTADLLGQDPADCVVVEDSRNGALAATRAGMTCIGYRTAINPEQDLSVADEIVHGPDQLRDALARRAR